MTTEAVARLRIRVRGIVQGVGFRPFLCGLAAEHGVAGFVGNDTDGVFIEAEAVPRVLDGFVADIGRRAPALAVVEQIDTRDALPVGGHGFRIVASEVGATRQALVAPDAATCVECLAEIHDPGSRRYRYPFTNCTNCGPRYTIVTDVPYDRAVTTMAAFAMCPDCAREYRDPGDRRFHAEPVSCPRCGPRLSFLDGAGAAVAGDALDLAVRWLAAGRILALKGIGGYHLAVLADDERAVAALRARKRREEKPFAIMACDLAAAASLVRLDAAARSALTGVSRPVVLLPRLPQARVAPSVAPGNRQLGIMLPYTPLHHLLAAGIAAPFVLTSGNASDEPIAYRDEDAHARLAGIADGFLVHDRRIHVRVDDSVVRLVRGQPQPLRRARGLAPAPISVPWRFRRPVLACGAELKNTFCLARDRRVFVSPHVGDLENRDAFAAYTSCISHLARLFDLNPRVVAHDLHPEYLSTKYAQDLDGVDLIGVQHHHAHIASCLADNGESGPALGVAFDGLGYGEDATMWGGELLLADLRGYQRLDHLEPIRMPGGTAAIRQPWRMAAAYLDREYGADAAQFAVARRHADQWDAVVRIARAGVNSPPTSSAGRLFDAVAAIAGVRDAVTYEGQAAIELEQRVDPASREAYPVTCPGTLAGVSAELIRAVAADVRAGVATDRVATRFHHGLADAVVAAVRSAAERTGVRTVAFSGGVFQNVVLLERVVSGVERAALRPLVHRRVPPNDGGICLGQAVIAAARDRDR